MTFAPSSCAAGRVGVNHAARPRGEQSGRRVRCPRIDMQTQITVMDGKIVVSGPYSESNNARYRSLGGKFSGGNWVLPDNDSVRAALAEMYGTKSDPVEVLVPLEKAEGRDILQIGGYVLAQRRGRDWRVQMPDGVSLASGSFPASGGSMKHPMVNASNDTVFRLVVRSEFAAKMGLDVAGDRKASAIEV